MDHLYYFLAIHSLERGFSYRSVIRAVGIVQPVHTTKWLQTISHLDSAHAGVRLANLVLSNESAIETLADLVGSLRDDSELPEPFTVMSAGALYERHLRALCIEHDLIPASDTIKQDGNMAKYYSLLHSSKIFSLSERQFAEQMGKWRNDAAHGNFEAVAKGAAQQSVDRLRQLIRDHPLSETEKAPAEPEP